MHGRVSNEGHFLFYEWGDDRRSQDCEDNFLIHCMEDSKFYQNGRYILVQVDRMAGLTLSLLPYAWCNGELKSTDRRCRGSNNINARKITIFTISYRIARRLRGRTRPNEYTVFASVPNTKRRCRNRILFLRMRTSVWCTYGGASGEWTLLSKIFKELVRNERERCALYSASAIAMRERTKEDASNKQEKT